MKKLFAALGSACTIALGFSGAAFAASPDPAPAPAAELDILRTYGYAVSVDGNRVHVYASDPGGPGSRYSGRITTDGAIHDITLNRPERSDRIWAGVHEIGFSFDTWNAVDGVSFTVAEGSQVTFVLERNGRRIGLNHILLEGGSHPESNPFSLALP